MRQLIGIDKRERGGEEEVIDPLMFRFENHSMNMNLLHSNISQFSYDRKESQFGIEGVNLATIENAIRRENYDLILFRAIGVNIDVVAKVFQKHGYLCALYTWAVTNIIETIIQY